MKLPAKFGSDSLADNISFSIASSKACFESIKSGFDNVLIFKKLVNYNVLPEFDSGCLGWIQLF